MTLLLLAGCIENTISTIPLPPVATPPPPPTDGRGDPPNWNDCGSGFVARYTNLTVDHPFVEPDPLEEPPEILFEELDWWDDPSYEDFTPTLNLGANWWPLDEGLEGDPAYFAVHWTGWLRAWDDTTMTYTLGSSDDVWIFVGDELIHEAPGIKPYAPENFSVSLEAGQYPMDVYFAHRSGGSGFRFRILSGDVSQCYAAFDLDEE